MISFDHGGSRFKFRVAGACVHDSHVLLTTSEKDDYWMMPGGKVELLEDTEAALRREMREELGCEIRGVTLLWVIEDFYGTSGKRRHELSFVYRFTPADRHMLDHSFSPATTDAGVEIRFSWFPLDGIERMNLKPAFFKQALRNPPDDVRHVIIHE